MGFLLEKDKEIGRSAAESFGNHASNDVLAANVAKSIVYGNGLVTPEFLSQVTSEGVNPLDAALFVKRVNEHITDILDNDNSNEVLSRRLSVSYDTELSEYMSGVKISSDAPVGAFLSASDCPDDRGKWFIYENGKFVQCYYRNAAEDPKIPYGQKWIACLTNQEFYDFLRLRLLLVQEIIKGGDVLDRATFYRLSQNFSEPIINSLQKSVSAMAKDHYSRVRSEISSKGRFDIGGYAALDNKFVDRQVKSWFRPWTRLAGRMENEIDIARWDREEINCEPFYPGDLSAVLDSFSKLPEYQPYLDREFKDFVANICEKYGFDYLKMPERFRDADSEKTWKKNHPVKKSSRTKL